MLKRNIYKIPGPNLSEDNRGRNQMFPEWPNYFNIDIIRHLTKKIVLEKPQFWVWITSEGYTHVP